MLAQFVQRLDEKHGSDIGVSEQLPTDLLFDSRQHLEAVQKFLEAHIRWVADNALKGPDSGPQIVLMADLQVLGRCKPCEMGKDAIIYLIANKLLSIVEISTLLGRVIEYAQTERRV